MQQHSPLTSRECTDIQSGQVGYMAKRHTWVETGSHRSVSKHYAPPQTIPDQPSRIWTFGGKPPWLAKAEDAISHAADDPQFFCSCAGLQLPLPVFLSCLFSMHWGCHYEKQVSKNLPITSSSRLSLLKDTEITLYFCLPENFETLHSVCISNRLITVDKCLWLSA